MQYHLPKNIQSPPLCFTIEYTVCEWMMSTEPCENKNTKALTHPSAFWAFCYWLSLPNFVKWCHVLMMSWCFLTLWCHAVTSNDIMVKCHIMWCDKVDTNICKSNITLSLYASWPSPVAYDLALGSHLTFVQGPPLHLIFGLQTKR